jgi:hypothetical protein
MRKIGATVAVAALAAVIVSPPPAAAFGIRIGPFHIGIPFYRHRHRDLYMHGNPNDLARPGAAPGAASALLYPSAALPGILQNVFFPTASSVWPFGYQAIFTTAFAKAPPAGDPRLCQPAVNPDAIVGRMRTEVTPTDAQIELLQRLGGALGAASGFLAKSCANEIPAQPVARLQLMESQIEELTMAIDIVRQPLQDFEQSLSADQRAHLAAAAGQQTAAGCDSSQSAIDGSIDQISQTVLPTDAQRDALNNVRQVFAKAASDLDVHCPVNVPPTALGRLEAVEARLDATWRAALSIQVALAGFETKLSDAQKSRFEAMTFVAAR